ncbi:MAG: hypothetical protein DCC55_10925 [Chloroflexi bacterium]|nr:MAG: hypothetical protein DCC55_10925 [Chloroflexota bacterium]
MRRVILFVVVLLVTLLLPGCRSIRPVEKIGLLAPFEGLYRRTGYAALDAMRTALSVAPQDTVDRLPLALDIARNSERTAHKLLADKNVRAVIGPLSLEAASAVEEVLADSPILWLAPFAIDANGSFVPVDQTERWVKPWLSAVVALARQQGHNRLVVAGWPGRWSQLALEVDGANPPFIVLSDDPLAVEPTDVVLHVGEPATVARYLQTLRAHQPHVPLYLGPQGEDPVLREHSEIMGGVYWMAWVDDGYETWTTAHGVESPLRYLVYRATMTAIGAANGESPEADLRIQWYAYDETGHWRAVAAPGAAPAAQP